MSVPTTIHQEAFNLDSEAYIYLFKLVLTDDTIVCISPKGEYTWQGDLYEEIPCNLTGVSRQADGSMSRPRFSIVNPSGIFTSAVDTRILEGASLTRYRILSSDMNVSEDMSLANVMKVSRVASVSKQMIVLETRGALDGALFRLPYRTFHPPEFPHVRLR